MATPFIAIEGVDGAGKSTQVERLAARWRAHGRDPLVVREPGGTALGEEVRRLLLHRTEIELHPETETLLFLASRVQLYEERIRPALAAGRPVISDRYHLSTLVYQAWAGAGDRTRITNLLEVALAGRRPQRVVVLDLPAELTSQRLSGARDRFEERPGFLARVAAAFRDCPGLPGDDVRRIDGVGDVEEVAERLGREVDDAL